MEQDIFSTPACFLNDQETDLDLINNLAISSTIVNLIDNEKENPVTIGVHGDWGSGKSSVLKMVEKELAKDKEKILCIKFNGWQFQGFEDSKIAIIEEITTKLINSKTLLNTSKDNVVKVLNSINWMKLGKFTLDAATVSQGGFPISSYLNLPDDIRIKEEQINGELKGKIEEFRENFIKLFDKTGYTKLVVLIDDLDRCLPKTIIETLESIRLFLFLPKTIFIIGADEKMIEYAVKNHFPQLDEIRSVQADKYARSYLEKLIQLPIRLTSLGEVEANMYITLLLLGNILGEKDIAFEKIRNEALAIMKKPWDSKNIKIEQLQAILVERFKEIQPVLEIISHINPILSKGTQGNPRQIKRFLSALNIRLQLSNAKGFGKLIKSNVLAKIMLAEFFIPDMIDHITKSVAENKKGICEEIRKFELAEKEYNTPVIAKWKENPEIVNWIGIDPNLGNIDLRPYLFVMKDRVKFSLKQEVLSEKIQGLLEKLSSGKLGAASSNDELKTLSNEEINILFENLQDKFLIEEDLSIRPNSFIGIQQLIPFNSELEVKYVDMLASIPDTKFGIWVASGHNKVIKTASAKEKLEKLINKWKKEDCKNIKLKNFLNKNIF